MFFCDTKSKLCKSEKNFQKEFLSNDKSTLYCMMNPIRLMYLLFFVIQNKKLKCSMLKYLIVFCHSCNNLDFCSFFQLWAWPYNTKLLKQIPAWAQSMPSVACYNWSVTTMLKNNFWKPLLRKKSVKLELMARHHEKAELTNSRKSTGQYNSHQRKFWKSQYYKNEVKHAHCKW